MKTALLRGLVPWLFILCLAAPALAQLPAGEIAPDFRLPDTNGQQVRLSAYEGTPLVLILGTTWCPGCKAQLAEMEKISGFLDQHQIPVLDVYLQERNTTVTRYLQGKDLPAGFKALIDDGQVRRAYRVYPIPRLLVLDASRHIVVDSLGTDAEELVRILQKLVEAHPKNAVSR